MNIAQLLARAARVFPDRPAILHGDRKLHDYREFGDRVARLAHFLRDGHRLDAGERIAIFMDNRPEYLETLYAILWAGLVAVPINAKLHPREVRYILADAQVRMLVTSSERNGDFTDPAEPLPGGCTAITCDGSEYLQALTAPVRAPADRLPDDVAWLFYTSGTTGQPKGVMLSHRNLMTMTSSYLSDVDAPRDHDAMVYAAPISHGAGLYGFACTLKAGLHLVPASGGFDPDELIALACSPGNLTMFAAPTMVKRLIRRIADSDASTAGFRTIIYGGGAMYLEDIREALEVMGPRFVQIYGQGESPMTITVLPRELLADRTHPDWATMAASVGFAQSQVEVRIVDDQGDSLGPGEVGEVLVRGDVVMLGYWQNREATAKALRDGWLWTGDMGALDSRGFLTLKDRSKDVIISGGSNIYPREVEEVLLKHPGVLEVSVVGRRDPEWGEVPVAFVVAEGVPPESLDRLCLAEIARFKRPREYRFVQGLPKNNYGKVLKTELRKMLE